MWIETLWIVSANTTLWWRGKLLLCVLPRKRLQYKSIISHYQVIITEEWGRRLRVLCMWCEWKSILRSAPLNLGLLSSLTSRRMSKCEKNHYSYKKVLYLSDNRWLITVEAVSMAASSLAARGEWDFHPKALKWHLRSQRERSVTCWNDNFAVKYSKSQQFYISCLLITYKEKIR